jgi:hypothetical protein
LAVIIQTIDCDECGGKSIVKIPSDYSEDFSIVACPLCGGAVETHEDLDDLDE